MSRNISFLFRLNTANCLHLVMILMPIVLLAACSCSKEEDLAVELSTRRLFVRDGSADLNNIYTPADIAVGPQGDLYIIDVVQMAVIVLDPNGQFVRTFGSKGEAPGEFNFLYHNFDLDEEGNVYLIDYPSTVIVYTADGVFQREIETGFGMIFDLAATDSDHLYINGFSHGVSIMDLNSSAAVTLLDSDGAALRTFGRIDLSHLPAGIEAVKDREAACACAVDVDECNSVYYLRTSDYTLCKYDSTGTLEWSVKGPSPYEIYYEEMENGFNIIPVAWDLDVADTFVYVSWAQGGDEEGNRIDVFNADDGSLEYYFFSQVPTEKWNFSIEIDGDSFYAVDYDGAMIHCFQIEDE